MEIPSWVKNPKFYSPRLPRHKWKASRPTSSGVSGDIEPMERDFKFCPECGGSGLKKISDSFGKSKFVICKH